MKGAILPPASTSIKFSKAPVEEPRSRKNHSTVTSNSLPTLQNVPSIKSQPNLLSKPHPPRFGIGLENLGNTCFMNSSLQCLLHIEPLVSYFASKSYKADLINESKGIAVSFAKLVSQIASSSEACISPVQFQKSVSNFFTNN